MTILNKSATLIPPADLLGAAGSVKEISAPGRRNIPALDGLRGGAILLVLVCHYSSLLPQSNLFVGVLANGWAGVDLFFVLSGFLITGILFDAKGTSHYFRNFYARRTLRIFPLYYGFLAAMVLLLLVLRFRPNASDGSQSLWNYQPWLWTYTANFKLPFEKTFSEWLDAIVPLWSLSVEEQFYLVWPLVVFFFSHRALIRICAAVLAGALVLRLVLTASGPNISAIYMMTPTRADSLAAGALVALLLRLPNGKQLVRRLAKYAGAIAAVLILLGLRGFDPLHHPYLHDVLYTNLAIFFAALLFWAIDPASLRGIPNRFYETRLMRMIGGYSYGMYVFHLPLMHPTKHLFTHWGFYDPKNVAWLESLTLVAANAALTFGLAFISFHLYEKQFLKLKRYFPERSAHREAAPIRRL